MAPSNVLLRPQPEAIQFTVIESRKQEMCMFTKSESENFDFFSLKVTQTD